LFTSTNKALLILLVLDLGPQQVYHNLHSQVCVGVNAMEWLGFEKKYLQVILKDTHWTFFWSILQKKKN
jgi:hypothetical protein